MLADIGQQIGQQRKTRRTLKPAAPPPTNPSTDKRRIMNTSDAATTQQLVVANTFHMFRDLGYPRLVPIVPVDAPVSESSMLAKRPESLGKAVGIKGRDGKWRGMDWLKHEPQPDDYERWHAMGAGVGIRTGEGIVAIDADTLDSGHARTIRDIAEKHFGRLPVRVGRFPKALYVIRTTASYRYTRLTFGAKRERVEVLSDGRQFVAHGIHPHTKALYHWTRGVPNFRDIHAASPTELDAFMDDLRMALPDAGPVEKEGSTTERAFVNQEALRGRLEHIRAAVEAIPNDKTFEAREAYVKFGIAIKAALPDHPDEAFDLFADWCSRWTEGTNKPDTVAADWRGIHGPFEIGAGYIYDMAERLAPHKFSSATLWFEPIPTDDMDLLPKPEAPQGMPERRTLIDATPYDFPDPSAIPRREWIYGTHYIRQFISTTVAPSGVGKSSLSIVEALAMASGKPLLGIQPKAPSRVWLWNGEDPIEEMQRRIAAAMLHYGLTREDIGSNLFLNSGRQTEIILAQETRTGVVINEPVERALHATIAAHALDVLVIDPFVSSHRVTENDNGAIDLVTKRWARIADVGRCSIDLVHHVRKLNGGEVTVEDGRGAVALLATSRSARAIARMTKQEAEKLGLEKRQRRMFRFADGKNNLALPAGDETDWFELASVGLGNGPAGDGALDRLLEGDQVGVVTRWAGAVDGPVRSEPDKEERVLTMLEDAEYRVDHRAGEAWAGMAVASVYGLDRHEGDQRKQIKDILSRLVRSGRLKEVIRKDAKRMPKAFFEVVRADKLSGGVFE